jgi:hypothetical protein
MPADARSQRLLSWHSTAPGYSPGFYVPAGLIVLVKSILVQNRGAAAGSLDLNLQAADGTASIAFAIADIPPGVGQHAEFWIVLNPGDFLSAYLYAADLLFWLSGAVLQGSPPMTPPVVALTGPTPLPAREARSATGPL